MAEDNKQQVTRRAFLSFFWAGWMTFSVVLGVLVTLTGRFLFPNVLFEKPSRFRAGELTSFAPGVDERFKDSQSVWIVRTAEDNRVFALSTVCTHLGCTPNWLQGELKFKCPCHGSGYRISGLHFEGPAPRPLERFAVTVDDFGNLIVDKARVVRDPIGWDNNDFFVKAI